jgi:HEPN domain-containing protein
MEIHEAALQFLSKGNDDLHAAEVLMRDETISDAIIGFHCQQAAEKYLKAVLLEKGVYFPRTHDLPVLEQLLTGAGETVPVPLTVLLNFNAYAVELRYIDRDQTIAFDREANIAQVRQLRDWVSQLISAT